MEQSIKICCYTCITGGYDKVYEPTFITSDIDYICFTDSPIPGRSAWQFRPIPKDLLALSAVKQQRIVKICPHRYLGEYDVSVWVDGNIQIIGDLSKFIQEYDLDSTSFYTRVHPTRKCVYDEADAVVKFGKDDPELVSALVMRYRKEGYPTKIGMSETNIILRAHNNRKCTLFDQAWATELLLNSHRDQLSFNYVAWKHGFIYGCLVNQFKINDSQYFRITQHKNTV